MTEFFNPSEIDAFRDKLRDDASNRGAYAGSKNDPRMLQFVEGSSHEGRLIATTNNSAYRKAYPFIKKLTHTYKGADGKVKGSVLCPRTYGLKCEICSQATTWYKDSKENANSKRLFDAHKNKLHGFGMLYVTDDNKNPANVGHVKIFHYSSFTQGFFDWEIWGFDPRNQDKKNKHMLLSNAFQFGPTGFSICIESVMKSGNLNQNFSWAKFPGAIEIDMAVIGEELKAINFDNLIPHQWSDELQAKVDKHYEIYVAPCLSNGKSMVSMSTPAQAPAQSAMNFDITGTGANTVSNVEEVDESTVAVVAPPPSRQTPSVTVTSRSADSSATPELDIIQNVPPMTKQELRETPPVVTGVSNPVNAAKAAISEIDNEVNKILGIG